MPQATVGDISSTSFDASSGTLSHIVAAGEGLLVLITLDDVDANKEVASVVWDAAGVNQALARPAAVAPFNDSNLANRYEVWFLAAPTAKTADITITMEGGSSQKTGVAAKSLSNVDPTTPFSDRTTFDSGSSATPSVTLTTGANDLAIMFCTHELKDSALAPDAGETEVADINVGGTYRFGAYYQDATGEVVVAADSAGGAAKCGALGFVVMGTSDAVFMAKPPYVIKQAVKRGSLY